MVELDYSYELEKDLGRSERLKLLSFVLSSFALAFQLLLFLFISKRQTIL